MVNFKGLAAKAKHFAQRNPDKVGKVIDQAGNFVDKRTGRKYERHVDTVQQKARQFLGGGRSTSRPPAGGFPADRPDQPGRPDQSGRPGGFPGNGFPDAGRPDQGPGPGAR